MIFVEYFRYQTNKALITAVAAFVISFGSLVYNDFFYYSTAGVYTLWPGASLEYRLLLTGVATAGHITLVALGIIAALSARELIRRYK